MVIELRKLIDENRLIFTIPYSNITTIDDFFSICQGSMSKPFNFHMGIKKAIDVISILIFDWSSLNVSA